MGFGIAMLFPCRVSGCWLKAQRDWLAQACAHFSCQSRLRLELFSKRRGPQNREVYLTVDKRRRRERR
jgi:hypothetical protein